MLLSTLLWTVLSICSSASVSALPCDAGNCARAPAAVLATTTTTTPATATPTTFILQIIKGGSYTDLYLDVGYVAANNKFAAIAEPEAVNAAYYTLSSTNELLLSDGALSSQNSSQPHSAPVYFTSNSAFAPIRCYKLPNPLNVTTPFLQCAGVKPSFVFMQVCGNVPPIPYPAFVIGDSVSSGCYGIQLQLIPKKNPFG